MQRGNCDCYMESSFFILEPAGVYNPPAVPSGAAQGAHYPEGTRGNIQAVTVSGGSAVLLPGLGLPGRVRVTGICD